MDRIPARRMPSGASSAPVTALVVDDDPSIVRFVEMYLENQGLRVHSALRGEDGAEMAGSLEPDVVVLDQGLTDLDAAEVLRRLRADPKTRRIPVLLMASESEGERRVKTLGDDADDYITKPFDIRELKARLLALVARRREQAEATEVEKLRTVREVVASVSHELNNPLAAVLMAAEALSLRHPGVGDVQEKSRVIQENALRIRDILKRLERVRILVSKPYVAGERMLDLAGNEEDLT